MFVAHAHSHITIAPISGCRTRDGGSDSISGGRAHSPIEPTRRISELAPACSDEPTMGAPHLWPASLLHALRVFAISQLTHSSPLSVPTRLPEMVSTEKPGGSSMLARPLRPCAGVGSGTEDAHTGVVLRITS